MRFTNPTTNTLTFELRGEQRTVAAGASIDVPENLVYAIKGMGLPLVEAAPPAPPPEPEPPAKPKK